MTALALERPALHARSRAGARCSPGGRSRALVTLLAFLAARRARAARAHSHGGFYAQPFALLGVVGRGLVRADRRARVYADPRRRRAIRRSSPCSRSCCAGCTDAFGLPYTAGGALIANVSLAGRASSAFYELGARVVGDRGVARRAACFMAVTPMGFVFSMSYPESLAARVDRVGAAGGVRRSLAPRGRARGGRGARAPEAVVLVVPLAAIAWRARRGSIRRARTRARGGARGAGRRRDLPALPAVGAPRRRRLGAGAEALGARVRARRARCTPSPTSRASSAPSRCSAATWSSCSSTRCCSSSRSPGRSARLDPRRRARARAAALLGLARVGGRASGCSRSPSTGASRCSSAAAAASSRCGSARSRCLVAG